MKKLPEGAIIPFFVTVKGQPDLCAIVFEKNTGDPGLADRVKVEASRYFYKKRERRYSLYDVKVSRTIIHQWEKEGIKFRPPYHWPESKVYEWDVPQDRYVMIQCGWECIPEEKDDCRGCGCRRICPNFTGRKQYEKSVYHSL